MSKEQGTANSDFESIGTCFMQEDGALILRLRAIAGPGRPGEAIDVVGSATITYACNDPAYDEILEHVKPIKPGETKLVAPWPD